MSFTLHHHRADAEFRVCKAYLEWQGHPFTVLPNDARVRRVTGGRGGVVVMQGDVIFATGIHQLILRLRQEGLTRA
jgi:hypothetical protein